MEMHEVDPTSIVLFHKYHGSISTTLPYQYFILRVIAVLFKGRVSATFPEMKSVLAYSKISLYFTCDANDVLI